MNPTALTQQVFLEVLVGPSDVPGQVPIRFMKKVGEDSETMVAIQLVAPSVVT